MGCGARRRAGRGRGQSGGGPGARGARRHGGRRGARPPLTRRSVPVVGEPEPPGALRRGDEQVRGAPLLPAGLQRLEGGDQDAAGARRRSPRSVRGGGAREARGPGPVGFCVGHGPAAVVAAGGETLGPHCVGGLLEPQPQPHPPGLQPPRRAPEGAAPPGDAEAPRAEAPAGSEAEAQGGAGGTSCCCFGGLVCVPPKVFSFMP